MILKRKKYWKILLMPVMLLCMCLAANAGTDPEQTWPLLGSKDSVKVNYVTSVADYQNLLRIQNPGLQPGIEAGTTRIVNRVSVGIEEDGKTYIQTDFTVTIVLHIKKYNQSLMLTDEFDSSFTINYLKAEGAKYTSLKYLVFENAYQTDVKIVSIDTHGTTSWDVTKVLRVDNTMQATRDYVFNCSNGPTNLSVSYDNTKGELMANWTVPLNGQTEFDLEWAWVADDAEASYQVNGAWNEALIFHENATRITTVSNSYLIPLLYDGGGKIFIRVRPAQMKTTGQRVEGGWVWKNGSTDVLYLFTGHETNLNWQASTSYAEEGKRKSVIQYFDGTLRNRQTVTKDNTTGTTVVAESFYDYQGRPVIQVLPAPTLNTVIAYSQNFNKSINFDGYPKWVYDKLQPNTSNCGIAAQQLDPISGTAKYYSPGNPLITSQAGTPNPNNYIPDAEGYPFTETRFTPDGRVAAQGGVGASHQIGSNHETKYVYEAPAQEELDALLGTDAGLASHYFKNIVKDANGQYSISYTDMHGRTVATALAGASPQQLTALSSFNKKYAVRQLIDDETNRVVGKSIISSKSIAALADGPYSFHYELKPDQLMLPDCYSNTVCYDCLYNLKITITSDCTLPGFPYVVADSNFTVGQLLNNPQCNAINPGKTTGWFNKTFSVWLPEGSYTVTKVLTLSDSAQRIYREEVYVKKDTCKKFIDFYSAELNALLSESNCAMTCVSCTTAIGATFAAFRSKFVSESGFTEPLSDSMVFALTAAYNSAKANCDRICNGIDDDGLEAVRAVKKIMLLDVTPPHGQYAKTDLASLGGTYNIFNGLSPWVNTFNTYKPAFSHPVIYNWSGTAPSLLNRDFINNLGSRVEPQYNIGFPNANEFIAQWDPAFAEQLLPNHPEYAKLRGVMEKLPDTYKFEADLNKLETWSAMVAATSTPGQYITDIVEKDPFFKIASGTAPGAAYKPAFKLRLEEYVNLTYGPTTACPNLNPTFVGMANLWQIAQSIVFCRNSSTDNCEYSDMSQCVTAALAIPELYPTTGCATDWDLIWKNFRTLYLSERKRWISQYLNLRPAAVSAASLTATGYTARFYDFNQAGTPVPGGLNAGDLSQLFTQLNSSNPATAQPTGMALLNAQYSETCKGYANTWISQLSQCGILSNRWQTPAVKTSDSTWIVNRLIDICEKGSDTLHMLGSSTIDPSKPTNTSYGFREFPEVIAAFFTMVAGIPAPATATCHLYLITVPKPYDRQPALANAAVLTKPTVCECTQITAIFNEYTGAQYPGTFSSYLQTAYHTGITQGALDTLLSLCNGSYQCVFLPKIINLPPILQCHPAIGGSNNSPACISCDDYSVLKTNFAAEFGFAAPVANPQNETDLNKNIAFQAYANFKTGFSKSWADYLAFGIVCDFGTTVPCPTLNATLQQFYLSSAYQQNPTGVSCQQAFVTFFNSSLGVTYTYQEWMNLFLERCGSSPNPCAFQANCPNMKVYINEFYATYGYHVYQNVNCMQLFTSFMNVRLNADFTYEQIENLYKYVCNVNCALDICSFPNCYLLTNVYNDFFAANDGHPWMLPDCENAFVNYFNNYFNLSPAWTYGDIATAFNNCFSVFGDINGCAPDLSKLCTPDMSCPSLEYIVLLFNQTHAGETGTGCEEAFVIFFNNLTHLDCDWPKILELYIKYCGAGPDVCNGEPIDCRKLFIFLDYFAQEPQPSDMTCQEWFLEMFNGYFGTNYTAYYYIHALYRDHCDFTLKTCGAPAPPMNCQTLQEALDAFYVLYPDPPTQLGTDCQITFRAFFNNYFSLGGIMGGYSFTQIMNAYGNCGIPFSVCGSGGAGGPAGEFVIRFAGRFNNLQVPLAVRQDLFTRLYNEEFINSKSVNADHTALYTDGNAQLDATVRTSEQAGSTIRIISKLEDIMQVLTTAEKAVVNNAPLSVSAYSPAALTGMKQAYYVLHPYGLPADCGADFASWFNIFMGMNLSFADLAARYTNLCGVNAGYICNVPGAETTRSIAVEDFGRPGPPSASPAPKLCGLNEPVFPPYHPDENPCADLPSIAFNAAEIKWSLYVDSIRNAFDLQYDAKCMAAKNLESFTVSDTVREYHYTLYYYDQAGNLVKTVPPAGVDARHSDAAFLLSVKAARAQSSGPVVPAHTLATEYRYNTLNQVVAQKTPDAGRSAFWYDRLGRLAVSQNAKQAAEGKYSYTEYDALGRITMVGQKPSGTAMTTSISRSVSGLESWLNATQNKEQITRTVYDLGYYAGEQPSLLAPTLYQKNLRNRVSYTQVIDAEPAGTDPNKWAAEHSAATLYSYDIHGNVDTLVQDYGSSLYHPNVMNTTGNRWKKMVYTYDLMSGKVNTFSYQPGKSDAFYHRYFYDAENRIIDVETSENKLIWEHEARYSYYKHGSLSRLILGDQQVQGIDYAYTLQGWLKGLNSTSVKDGIFDMGKDGVPNGSVTNLVTKDVFGYSLNYYSSDYKSIRSFNNSLAERPFISENLFGVINTNAVAVGKSLYNGNIASTFLNIPKIGEGKLYAYAYDQLSRLISMDAFKDFNNTSNIWNNMSPVASSDYKEIISYLPSGNINNYVRNGDATRINMDVLLYSYKPGTNQLDKVQELATDATAIQYNNYNDIKKGQLNGNYQYDFNGNLISDVSEGISNIQWNVYGKIKSISKTDGTIEYTYDASGNRLSKTNAGKTTYYIRDASGNIVSLYEAGSNLNAGALTQTEIYIYGSSRLGIYNMNKNVSLITSTPTNFDRGNKLYELNNHLGNVLVTISDKKIGRSVNNISIDWYEAEIQTANDYYPFGMQMPGRKFALADVNYRFGFNGKEKENDVKGAGNQIAFENRIYDPRLARWNSVDPLQQKYPNLSPYNFCANNPVKLVDPDGRDIIGFEEIMKKLTLGSWGASFNLISHSNVFMAYLKKYVNINSGNKLGAKQSGELSSINVKFELVNGETINHQAAATGIYYRDVNIASMTEAQLKSIDPKKLIIKAQFNNEDNKGAALSGDRLLTITHETALHVNFNATLILKVINDKNYTMTDLVKDIKQEASNVKGSAHWEIQPGTNQLYESMNDDLNKTIQTNQGLWESGEILVPVMTGGKKSQDLWVSRNVVEAARVDGPISQGEESEMMQRRKPTGVQFRESRSGEKNWDYNQNCTDAQKANPLSPCGAGLEPIKIE